MRRLHCPRYATPAQLNYLRRLLEECFAKRVEGYYINNANWNRIMMTEASDMISTLRARLGKSEEVSR